MGLGGVEEHEEKLICQTRTGKQLYANALSSLWQRGEHHTLTHLSIKGHSFISFLLRVVATATTSTVANATHLARPQFPAAQCGFVQN